MAYYEDIWEKDKSVTIDQIVAYIGQGPFNDNSPKQINLRQFIQKVDSSYLIKYLMSCLEFKYDWVGFVIQDIVNEIGSRLDFKVKFGIYRGTQNHNNYDGIWSTNNNSIVIETKKSAKFSYDLSKFEKYRKEIIEQEGLPADSFSILLVVGDENTENIEAQIRGSKYAWTIRIVSVRSLIKLLELKESSDDITMFDKINRVLTPQEYTKVDGIIDLVFSTAEAVKLDNEISDIEDTPSDINEKNQIEITRQKSLPIIGAHFNTVFRKKSRTTFISAESQILLGCYVSKEHQDKNYRYWFDFPFKHFENLKVMPNSYVVFVCVTEKQILVIPTTDFAGWLEGLNVTQNSKKPPYWHIHIADPENDFALIRKKGYSRIKLKKYLLNS